jgi:hypothetical protein
MYVPTNIPIHVPCNSVAAYQAASGWNNFTNYIDCVTGISNTQISEKLNIYISNGQLIIENGELAENVQIFDIAGKNIINYPLSIVNSIDVSGLSAGVYFVKIGNKTGKFVKK